MSERYSNETEPEAPPGLAQARELLARLLPGADAGLLVAGLVAEGAAAPGVERTAETDEADLDAPERELRRVRRQFALGEAARSAQHDLNNPLTALVAEVQLLALEPLAPEHRAAARRMVELARRVAAAARRLDVAQGPVIG